MSETALTEMAWSQPGVQAPVAAFLKSESSSRVIAPRVGYILSCSIFNMLNCASTTVHSYSRHAFIDSAKASVDNADRPPNDSPGVVLSCTSSGCKSISTSCIHCSVGWSGAVTNGTVTLVLAASTGAATTGAATRARFLVGAMAIAMLPNRAHRNSN